MRPAHGSGDFRLLEGGIGGSGLLHLDAFDGGLDRVVDNRARGGDGGVGRTLAASQAFGLLACFFALQALVALLKAPPGMVALVAAGCKRFGVPGQAADNWHDVAAGGER
ncbi:hypothetical protein D3C81_1108230 [compost metagenome]